MKYAELQVKFDGIINGNWIKAEIWMVIKWNVTKIWLKSMVTWLTCNEISWLQYEWMVNEIWIKYDCNQ